MPAPVTVAAMNARQRAQTLMDEARGLQKQGKLVEAKAKLDEARVAAGEAYKTGTGFGPGEESPDGMLLAMASQATTRINNLVKSADDNAASMGDAVRLKKAGDSLLEARQLAVLFNLDIAPIDLKLNAVAQRQGNPGSLIPIGAQTTSSDNMGLKLLDDARNEIRAGRLETARKIAEDALDAKYGVQQQAAQVLRSIDIGVFERSRLDNEHAFTAAYEAYLHKEYSTARSILANIDERQLSDEKKARLREIALQPGMQPQQPGSSVQLVGAPINPPPPGTGVANASDMQVPPGTANASDMTQPGSSGDDFGRYTAMARIQFDKLTKESFVAQRAAQERAKAGDYDGAIELLSVYNSNLGASGLEPEQVAVLRKSTDRYVQQYLTLKATKAFQQEQVTAATSGKFNEQKRMMELQSKQAEVAKLVDEAKHLMQDQKYHEAHIVYAHIQELDQENLAAQAGLWESNMREVDLRNSQTDLQKREFFLKGLDESPGPYVSTHDPFSFDLDRTTKNQKRKSLEQMQIELKDPKERWILTQLKERQVTLSFDNIELRYCIESLQDYVGNINIHLDDKAIKDAGIRMDMLVKMRSDGLNLQSCLRILLNKAGLTFVVQDQSIVITTLDNAKGALITKIYPVAEFVTPVKNESSPYGAVIDAQLKRAVNDALGGPFNNLGPAPTTIPGGLGNGTPVGSGYAGKGGSVLAGGQQEKLEDALIRVITNTIGVGTWSETGGTGTIQYFPFGAALVVGQQTQDIQEQIMDLLAALRKLQDLEVAIEMRLVSVSESFFEFMGVNFSLDLPTNNSASTIQTLTSGVFQPAGQINKFAPTRFVSGVTPAGTLTPDLSVPINASSFGFALPPFGGYPGTLGADGGLSLGLAFLSDVQVSMFLEAAQGDRRTNVMQAPKITVFNGQQANINVGDQLYFLTGINVVQIGGQTAFVPTNNPSPYGVFMTVTPVVSADRRFVRLNLNPQLLNLVSATVPLLPVQQVVPQLFFDGIQPPQPTVVTLFFQQPSSSFISLNTTVVVPDGGTVLMGGLKTLVEGRNEFGPPILSNIPYINRLFTNTGYGKETQSLMIMVTARIIINYEEEQEFLGTLTPPIPR